MWNGPKLVSNSLLSQDSNQQWPLCITLMENPPLNSERDSETSSKFVLSVRPFCSVDSVTFPAVKWTSGSWVVWRRSVPPSLLAHPDTIGQLAVVTSWPQSFLRDSKLTTISKFSVLMGQRSSLKLANSSRNFTTLNGNLTKQVFCQNQTSPSSAKKVMNKIRRRDPREFSSSEKAEEKTVPSNKRWDNRWRAILTKKLPRRLILISTSSFRNNRQLRLSSWFSRKQQHLHQLKAKLPLPKIMRSPLEQEYTHKAHNPRETLKLMIVDQIGD